MTEKENTLTEVKKEQENTVEILRPKPEPKTWTLTDGENSREYVQKPLSYFGKIEFFALVGEMFDSALQTGLSVNMVLNTGVGLGQRDFTDLDSFVMAFAKLARYSPDFLKDCYCVWLSIPHVDREWARLAMDNLDDEQGSDIMETFIDQNYEAVQNFFLKRAKGWIERGRKQQEIMSSAQSNNSKPTPAPTPKPSKKS